MKKSAIRRTGRRRNIRRKIHRRPKHRLPIHHTGLRKPGMKFQKVSGLRMKPNFRKPIHYITTLFGFKAAPVATWNQIWQTNGDWDAVPTRFFPYPAPAVGDQGRLTTKIQFLYTDLRFLLHHNYDTSYQAIQVPTFAQIRVIIVKRRSPVTGFAELPTGFLEPINAKLWDVQYDKFFNYHTGASSAFNATQISYSAGNHRTPPLKFHFKIPIKMTVDFNQQENNYNFPQDLFCAYYVNNPSTTTTIERWPTGGGAIPFCIEQVVTKTYFISI